ncbi:MAG: hypothetical protein GY772_18975 [bacterium]|nr:hypothetical protein [bacterium]
MSSLGDLPVTEVGIADYTRDLMQHLVETHAAVQRAQREAVEAQEGTMAGHVSSELFPGDTVLVKKDPTVDRVGALRFQPRVYPGVYRVKRKIDRHTFYVEDAADPTARLGILQPLNASRLVRLDICRN